MRETIRYDRLVVVVAAAFAVCLLTAGVAAAATWVDEISNSLAFYKSSYPTSNFGPYEQKLTKVREAVSSGDQKTIKMEMGAWLKMLRTRAHGINDVAADELFNFALMVTPVQEYGISVP